MMNRIAHICIFLLILFTTSCKSQEVVSEISPIKKHAFENLSSDELENVLQQTLNTNHLDSYFDEVEKRKGITVVINKFIEPYYKRLNLQKFNRGVNFQTHNEIYDNLNEKFVDIMNGSATEDSMTINVGLRSKFNAMFVEFVKINGKWQKITKDFKKEAKNLSTTNFSNSKENCLAHTILKKKYPEKYHYLRGCSEYSFNN